MNPARSPGPRWTAEALGALRVLSRRLDGDLDRLADATRLDREQVNQALDALLGRTPEDAAAALARRDRQGGWAPPGASA